MEFTVADSIPDYDGKRAEYASVDKAERAKARLAGETLLRTRKPAFVRAADAMQEVRKELGNIGSDRYLNLISEFRHPKDGKIAPGEHDPPDHIPDPAR